MTWINHEKVVEAVSNYADFIVGLKARISKSVVRDSGIEPLRAARELSVATSLPLMVHIGSGPPSIEEVVSLLENKDIITHYLNGKANNLLMMKESPWMCLRKRSKEAYIWMSGTAQQAFLSKLRKLRKTSYRFGHDLHGYLSRESSEWSCFNMSNVLTKFLYLGYSLEEVIAAVTTHAANWLNKPELGRIQVGDIANLTLFTVQNEEIQLTDSEGDTRTADRTIQSKGVVVNGALIKC